MLEEQFVTYKIAKELKVLGFDTLCFARFYDDNSTIGYQLVIDHNNQHIGSNVYHAPLWQQVFDWLEEKHKVLVSFSYGSTYFKQHSPMWEVKQHTNHHIVWCSGHNKNFLKAKEEATNKAIELISR